MKAIDNALERFCYKHPKFGIRNLMLYIVAGNALVYILGIMDTTGTFLNFLLFSPELIFKGQVWRLISFVFLPAYYSVTDIFWLAISLYFYYFIGSALERHWGPGKFTLYYISGVILNIVYGFILHFCGFGALSIFMTASYINLSMFFAFAVLWPETMVLLFFFIPVKVKWLAWLDAALFVYNIAVQMDIFPMNLLPIVAVLNFLIFCGSEVFRGFSTTVKRSSRVTDFKQAARRTEHEQNIRGYRHKCSVCGRTDTDYPDLEFRYCSRCTGYHCFCEDHINSHVHFTE